VHFVGYFPHTVTLLGTLPCNLLIPRHMLRCGKNDNCRRFCKNGSPCSLGTLIPIQGLSYTTESVCITLVPSSVFTLHSTRLKSLFRVKMIGVSFWNLNAWRKIRERVYDLANSNGKFISSLESIPESEISGR
jgi:hypothetical protein